MSDNSDAEVSDAESKTSEQAKQSSDQSDQEGEHSRVTVKDVLHAIRRMREPGGATFGMVKNYLSAESKFEGVSAKRFEKQVKLAMHKAIEEGKLNRAKRGLRFLLSTLVGSSTLVRERRRRRSVRRRGKSRSRSKRRRRRRKSRRRSRVRRRHRSRRHHHHH